MSVEVELRDDRVLHDVEPVRMDDERRDDVREECERQPLENPA